jgi:diphosphomevalonate decarboxylase
VEAVRAPDLEALGAIMERSAMRMHGSMLGADPWLCYFAPDSLRVLHAVRALRGEGVGAWATMDAGPNVKVLCGAEDAEVVAERLRSIVARVEVLTPGAPASVELLS